MQQIVLFNFVLILSVDVEKKKKESHGMEKDIRHKTFYHQNPTLSSSFSSLMEMYLIFTENSFFVCRPYFLSGPHKLTYLILGKWQIKVQLQSTNIFKKDTLSFIISDSLQLFCEDEKSIPEIIGKD